MRIAHIQKGSKTRKLYIPNKEEKYRLNLIKRQLDWLYLKLGIPNSVHGFLFSRSCVTNAKEHINQPYTLCMDIKDFFDSIGANLLSDIPTDILQKVLVDGAPRQGLPTSPTVSNLALRTFDLWIEECAQFLDCVYTRYADDITISGELTQIKILQHIIIDELMARGFQINKKKTRLQSDKNRRIITGLSVDHDVRATRKSRRKLRAAQHQNNNNQVNGLKEWVACREPMHCEWLAEGTIYYPIVTATYDGFRTGRRRKPTRTFRGSRAALKAHIFRRIMNNGS